MLPRAGCGHTVATPPVASASADSLWHDALAPSLPPRIKPEHESGRGVSDVQGSVYSFTRSAKLLHPRKVVVVQVGEFYEVMGYDAVLLVELAGLNPMGSGAADSRRLQTTADGGTKHTFATVHAEAVGSCCSAG